MTSPTQASQRLHTNHLRTRCTCSVCGVGIRKQAPYTRTRHLAAHGRGEESNGRSRQANANGVTYIEGGRAFPTWPLLGCARTSRTGSRRCIWRIDHVCCYKRSKEGLRIDVRTEQDMHHFVRFLKRNFPDDYQRRLPQACVADSQHSLAPFLTSRFASALMVYPPDPLRALPCRCPPPNLVTIALFRSASRCPILSHHN